METVTTVSNQFRRQRRRRNPHLLLVVVVLLGSACGAAEPSDPAEGATTAADSGPRVASSRFDGEFAITDLAVADEPVPLRTTATISIESEFGGLSVTPACNTYLGSFTLIESDEAESNLSDEGQASFTIAGGSDTDCGDLNDQEGLVLTALAAVDSWATTDDGFRFDGPDGSSFTITR